MAEVVVVSGTHTGVGKTWVTARLIERLRDRAIPVTARKPVQSFDIRDGTDADVLAAASGDEAHAVCPLHRWYEIPMAPPMAAEALGLPPIALADLVSELNLPDIGLALIEGVGGPRSPIADDADTTDLADDLGARLVVVVADPSLGVINSLALAVEAFRNKTIGYLNRFDPVNDLHARNLQWLVETEGFDVVTSIPELAARVCAATDVASGTNRMEVG